MSSQSLARWVWRLRLGQLLLVRRLESIVGCLPRRSRPDDLFPLTEETMSMTPIIFVLIILLFGFDSTGQLETGRKYSRS